jgi:hypothetical protein
MTDERNPEAKMEELELNRETVQDLTEGEAERAQGGRRYSGEQCSGPEYTCAAGCGTVLA